MGFGAEILFILLLGLLVLGPKRLHIVLANVARAKARFEEASRGFKSQLTAELEADSHGPGTHEQSRFLAADNAREVEPPVRSERPPDTRSGGQSTMIPAVSRETTPGGLDTLLETRYTAEFHAEFDGRGPRDAHLAASPGARGGSICPTIAATTSRVGP